MKIRSILIAGMLTMAFGAACVSNDPSPTPTRTTIDPDAALAADCADRAASLGNDLNRIVSQADYVDLTNPASVRSFISSARRAVTKGRGIISDCGHLAPAEALALGDSLDQIESSADALEDLL